MKRFEHALIVICGSLVLLSLIAISLANLVDDKKQEEDRRSKMYKIFDDNEKQ